MTCCLLPILLFNSHPLTSLNFRHQLVVPARAVFADQGFLEERVDAHAQVGPKEQAGEQMFCWRPFLRRFFAVPTMQSLPQLLAEPAVAAIYEDVETEPEEELSLLRMPD